VVCAVMIFLTLYGRYVKLYLLVLFYHIAMPLIVGGRELEHNGYAWVRTFLSNVFEIVAIALFKHEIDANLFVQELETAHRQSPLHPYLQVLQPEHHLA